MLTAVPPRPWSGAWLIPLSAPWMLSPQLIISEQRLNGTAQPIPWYTGRGGGWASQDFVILAGSRGARGHPAANVPCRGPGAATALAPASARQRRADRTGREGFCHLLWEKKGKKDSFLVWRLPGDVSQVHIYCLLPVKLCFYASQSHHFDVVCLAWNDKWKQWRERKGVLVIKTLDLTWESRFQLHLRHQLWGDFWPIV